MDKEKAQFLPFNAINVFMLPDFRQKVIQQVLTHLDQLPADLRSGLVASIKRAVKVPGFRNSAAAPVALKIKGAVQTFEQHPDFTARILAAWVELNLDLRQKVYAMMAQRNWELLPPDADRTRLPGFLTRWPESETYEALNEAYQQMYPEDSVDENDVRLMSVWLAGRLPYDVTEPADSSPAE